MRDVPIYFSRPSAILEKVREMPNYFSRPSAIMEIVREMPNLPILTFSPRQQIICTTLALDPIWPRCLRTISLKCTFQDISCIWSSNVFFLVISRTTLDKRTHFDRTNFNNRTTLIDKTALDNKSKQYKFGAGSLTPNVCLSLRSNTEWLTVSSSTDGSKATKVVTQPCSEA